MIWDVVFIVVDVIAGVAVLGALVWLTAMYFFLDL